MPRRPGPLQELPLSHFLPPDANLANGNPFTSPYKRPGSPSNLLTPTKKRILREERYAPPSPEPQNQSSRRRSPRLNSSSTSARKTSPKAKQGAREKINDTFGRIGAASKSIDTLKDTCIVNSSNYSNQPMQLRSSTQKSRSLAPIAVSILRDNPLTMDRRGSHYPGFDVHFDKKIEIEGVIALASLINSPESDKDSTKENMPPRRKMKKAMTDSFETGPSHLAVQDGGKCTAASAPPSVGRKAPHLIMESPRARYMAAKSPLGTTPGRSFHAKEDILMRKRAMAEEMDEGCSDIDDDAQL